MEISPKRCLDCDSFVLFKVKDGLKTWKKKKFCSIQCYWHFSSKFPNSGAYNGRARPEMTGSKHPNWKETGVGMPALHEWVKKHMGKPAECWHCGKHGEGIYEWANKSGTYKRELDDWLRLCASCHRRYDRIAEKMWITRRRKSLQSHSAY